MRNLNLKNSNFNINSRGGNQLQIIMVTKDSHGCAHSGKFSKERTENCDFMIRKIKNIRLKKF